MPRWARLAALHVLLALVTPDGAMVLSRRIEWDAPLTFAIRPEEMRLAR